MLRPRDLCQSAGTRTFLDAMHGGKMHLARFVLDALDSRIVNARAEHGRTPLMFAVCLPDPAVGLRFVRLLLEKGARVNEEDERGRTALSLACELGHLDAVKLLVQFNADPEIPDCAGNGPLMYAASAGHSAVIDFLLRAFKRLGLRLERSNHAGQSALQVASVRGHSECVRALSGRARSAGDASPEPPSPKPLPRQMLERFGRHLQSHRKSAQSRSLSLLPAPAWLRSAHEPLPRELSRSYELLPRPGESCGEERRLGPSRLLRSLTAPEEGARSQLVLSRGRGQPLLL